MDIADRIEEGVQTSEIRTELAKKDEARKMKEVKTKCFKVS